MEFAQFPSLVSNASLRDLRRELHLGERNASYIWLYVQFSPVVNANILR